MRFDRAITGGLVALALAALSGCGPSAGAARQAAPGAAVVTKVIDGDTLAVKIGGGTEHVRLIGIDTPETHKPNTPVECFGVEATKALTRLVPTGTPLRLERDAELRDRYGRLLAYVYRAKDGLFVNLEMVKTGFAAAYTYPPNVAHTTDIVAAAGQARDAGRGLWSACGGGHVTFAM
ncbi:MAG: thermonuclease family protein [Actinobacteria bacterium]|nr:thermonuclease family protein [Actinomycetota bacterium]